MGKKLIDVDVEALAAAAAFYGTATNEETVNAALRDAAERRRRSEAFDRLRDLAADGDFDQLLDKHTYRP